MWDLGSCRWQLSPRVTVYTWSFWVLPGKKLPFFFRGMQEHCYLLQTDLLTFSKMYSTSLYVVAPFNVHLWTFWACFRRHSLYLSGKQWWRMLLLMSEFLFCFVFFKATFGFSVHATKMILFRMYPYFALKTNTKDNDWNSTC